LANQPLRGAIPRSARRLWASTSSLTTPSPKASARERAKSPLRRRGGAAEESSGFGSGSAGTAVAPNIRIKLIIIREISSLVMLCSLFRRGPLLSETY
jgi:hypothetical protein